MSRHGYRIAQSIHGEDLDGIYYGVPTPIDGLALVSVGTDSPVFSITHVRSGVGVAFFGNPEQAAVALTTAVFTQTDWTLSGTELKALGIGPAVREATWAAGGTCTSPVGRASEDVMSR